MSTDSTERRGSGVAPTTVNEVALSPEQQRQQDEGIVHLDSDLVFEARSRYKRLQQRQERIAEHQREIERRTALIAEEQAVLTDIQEAFTHWAMVHHPQLDFENEDWQLDPVQARFIRSDKVASTQPTPVAAQESEQQRHETAESDTNGATNGN